MRVTMTDVYGINHEADAELAGVDDAGLAVYEVDAPFRTEEMKQAIVDVLPARAMLVIKFQNGEQ